MNTTAPLVSVVMSVYNGEKYLAQAIESILAQSFRDFEFVIVNDGSTDGSRAILESFAARDKRIVLQHRPNEKLIAALNFGCRAARGRYIARMDADDVSLPERLAAQVKYLEEHPDVAVLASPIELINAENRKLKTIAPPSNPASLRAALLREGCVICHPTVLFRKSVWQQTGGYRRALVDAEDYDLWLRVSDRHALASLKEPMLQYRIHPSQISVRKCRTLAVNTMAARAAALARADGKTDPLDSAASITPGVLRELGLSEQEVSATLARYLLCFMRNMYQAGEYENARLMLDEALSAPELAHAARWVRSDTFWMGAKLHWLQQRPGKSARHAMRALFSRPEMALRPIKHLLARPASRLKDATA